uniref:Uncharacterized protein n=1 Tax=Rhizophora mucronata TaxID=61149 RepID=A0A2P2NPB4_RHIMU
MFNAPKWEKQEKKEDYNTFKERPITIDSDNQTRKYSKVRKAKSSCYRALAETISPKIRKKWKKINTK